MYRRGILRVSSLCQRPQSASPQRRPRFGSPPAAWLASFALVLPSMARAEPPTTGLRLDLLQPAAPDSPFVRAEGPAAAGADEVRWSVGASLDYAKSPLRMVGVDATGTVRELARLVDHSLVGRVSAAISPVRWLRLDVSLGGALFQEGSVPAGAALSYGGVPLRGASSQGLLDPRAGLLFRPYSSDAFSFAFGGRAWAPVGAQDAYLSDKRIRAEAGLHFFGSVSKFAYGASFDVSPGLFLERDGDRAAASLAVHRELLPWLSVGLEPSGAMVMDVAGPASAPSAKTFRWVAETLGVVRLHPGPVQVSVAVGPSFGTAPGVADVRAMLSFAYVGRASSAPIVASDPDGDGLVGEADACPQAFGPKRDDAAQSGCPMGDDDGDGIPDSRDACRGKAGVNSPDTSLDGCPDADNDGVADPLDLCAGEPGYGNHGDAPRGCPAFARLVESSFVVKPALEFAPKDSKLPPQADAALEEIAATLRANPSLTQVVVLLSEKNATQQLTDARVKNLFAVFQRLGLEPSRYQVEFSGDLGQGQVRFKVVR